jgi:hypothetical protein
VAQAFEQLCLLKEARQNVQRDMEDKEVTLGIGVHNVNLTKESPGISYKPGKAYTVGPTDHHSSFQFFVIPNTRRRPSKPGQGVFLPEKVIFVACTIFYWY